MKSRSFKNWIDINVDILILVEVENFLLLLFFFVVLFDFGFLVICLEFVILSELGGL